MYKRLTKRVTGLHHMVCVCRKKVLDGIFQWRTAADTRQQIALAQAEGDEMMVYKTAESLYFVMRVDCGLSLWKLLVLFGLRTRI